MRIGPLRLLVVVAAVVALAAPAATLAGPRQIGGERGVVQAIDAQHIVLKALDGTQVSFGLFPGTQVRLNGARASALDVVPGYVADVTADGKGRALLIRAYGTAVVDRGVVTAVTRTSLTIVPEGGAGAPLTITFDRSTKLKLGPGGGPAGPLRKAMLRTGVLVTVTHAPDGPALVITILKRAGA